MLSVALLVCAHAAVSYADSGRSYHDNRSIRASEKTVSSGCYNEGTWHRTGSEVRTREACLSCVCAQGALSCRRRSCAPTPDPPPQCYLVHRRGDCCPELHCPGRIAYSNDAASSRTDDPHIDMPSSIGHACVEGGTIYAAGSAMASNVACEQCFCLAGMRRCVKPRCLPPPDGCTARPSSGACCPQRYYCVHADAKPPNEASSHDCRTPEGHWIHEGSRVKESEDSDCIQCFCLHGSIRCQHLSCAPTLHGCKPLVQAGQCCAHQYMCNHNSNGTKLQNLGQVRPNILLPLKEETRSFHTSKSTKRETTSKGLTVVNAKSTAAIAVTKEDPIKSTTKVKRKAEENLFTNTISIDRVDTTKVMTTQTTLNNNDITSTIITESTTEMTLDSEESTTEQPEGVRIIINGTINCTAELSSTSLFLNGTDNNETIWIQNQVQPRIPLIGKIENVDHTFSPIDIITEGYHNDNFDENESFIFNVTSSLQTNSTRISPSTISSTISSTSHPKTILPLLMGALNNSKTKKEEYDYDYREPTLPPSLPNLKIIPFVAADAVVDDNMSSKEMPDYPSLTKDAQFPVYYPTKESKETVFATRRDDIYNLTHYMFAPEKNEPLYPGIIQDEDPVKMTYPSIADNLRPDIQEYSLSASYGNPAKISSHIKSELNPVSKFDLKIPDLNLFSPPVETEGGFIPKDPALIHNYYSLYQKTTSGIIPHLTTSMPLSTKEECLTEDGRRVPEGESITFDCSVCSCAWGELLCSPQPCHNPSGCKRQKNSSGEFICGQVEKNTEHSIISTSSFQDSFNETTAKPTFEDTNDENNNNKSLKAQFKTTTTLPNTNEIILNPPTTEKSNDPILQSNHSLDYDEDDDEEGFSLGSVLKLLLSETYEKTTSTPKQQPTTATHPPLVATTVETATTNKQSGVPAFVPIKHHYPYLTPKHPLKHFNTVDRIDHLVLGEASAIRTTSTQTPVTFKTITYTTSKRIFTTQTTQKPVTTKFIEINSKEGFVSQSVEKRPTSNLVSGFGFGLPKLAGCNIYGRMYRVGRIIAELTSPCQECKCTEVGVQCRSLAC